MHGLSLFPVSITAVFQFQAAATESVANAAALALRVAALQVAAAQS